MASKTKKQKIELLSTIKGVGLSYAKSAVEELGIEDIAGFISACEKGELQKLSGVGEKKEAYMLASALIFESEEKKKIAEKPASKSKPKKKTKTKSSTKKTAPKKKTAKKKSKKATAKKPLSKKKKNVEKTKPLTSSNASPKKKTPKPESNSTNSKASSIKREANQYPKVSKVTLPGLVFRLLRKIASRVIRNR